MNLTPDKNLRRVHLRTMREQYAAAWNAHAGHDRKGGSSATPEQKARITAECGFDWTNEMASELELLDFIADEPSPVFAFPSKDRKFVTNFVGDRLATIHHLGPLYEGGFHGTYRQTFRALAINGREYFGTIYGTYIRMRIIRLKNITTHTEI